VLAVEIPLEASGLEGAQDRIESYLEEQGVAHRARYKVRLVLDELIANLLLHGRFDNGRIPVRVEVQASAAGVMLALEDAAAPFDPRATADPATPPSLDDDKVGGLGLSLVRRMAEIRGYLRLPTGWNRTEFAITDA
jgi:anti-sigma regulatory factor (Ser/Thr protein kinase)